MPTLNNLNSPFSDAAPDSKLAPETSTNSESFPIRTMQDDLLELQKKPTEPQSIPPKTIHPFAQQTDETQTKKTDTIEIPLATKNVTDNAPVEVTIPKDGQKNILYKILIISAVVFLIAIIALGGYYFWITQNNKTVPQPAPVTEEMPAAPVEEAPAVIIPPVEKYSTEKPNNLPIDLTTLSAADIKKSINDVAQELKTESDGSLYEFIVVDNNNAPVAFPIFATAAKINLSQGILNNLGEEFSLFLYNDAGNMRLAIAPEITKPTNLPAEILKQEKTLVTDVAFILLNENAEITTGSFGNSVYKDVKIRFFNVTKQTTLSVDYAVTGNQLVIATSKNTLRSVLDKLAIQETKPTEIPSEQASATPGLE